MIVLVTDLGDVRGIVGLEDSDLDALLGEESLGLSQEDRRVVRRSVPAGKG